MTNWKDIHPSFGKEHSFFKCTCREVWESYGFTYKEAKRWVEFGLKPEDGYHIKEWEKQGFTNEETKQWINAGFKPYEIHEIYDGCTKNWKELGFTPQQAQEWVQAGWKSKNDILSKISWDLRKDRSNIRGWKDRDFTAREAQEWIDAGFEPGNSWKANSWKELGFKPQEVRSWINLGLKSEESNFASYLKQNNYQLSTLNVKEIIKRESWQNIHKNFSFYWRKNWEEKGFDYQETKSWIELGFKIDSSDQAKDWKDKDFDIQQTRSWMEVGFMQNDLDMVIKWKSKGFTPKQAKEWLETGLTFYEHELAAYLKGKGHKSTDFNIKEEIKKASWQDIHPKFNHKNRKNWERAGIDYVETRQWIELGFSPNELYKVQWWKKNGFDCGEIKQWTAFNFKVSDGYWIKWKKQGFTPKQVMDCQKIGLKEEEYEFANYLQKENHQPEIEVLNIERLREEWHWKDVHPEFDYQMRTSWEQKGFNQNEVRKWVKLGFNPKDSYCVESWIKTGFNIEEVKLWIINGFKPKDYDKVQRWKRFNFSPEEARQWKEIGFEYSEKHAEKWKELNFTAKETQQWIVLGIEKYHGFEFANYLKQKGHQPNVSNIQEIIEKESWRDVCSDFNYSLRKDWENRGFNIEQVKKLMGNGVEPKDSAYYSWLREIKNNDKKYQEYLVEVETGCKLSEEVIKQIKNFNFRNLTLEQKSLLDKLVLNQNLKEKCQKYGLCEECYQPNTSYNNNSGGYCQPCNAKRFQTNFKNWTSGNQKIDKFIQKHQLEATDKYEPLEWIPYEKFRDVEYLAEGGFSKVYKAKVEKYGNVVLKNLNNSRNMTTDFLSEVAHHKLVFDHDHKIAPCYGISCDLQTGNYIMVIPYADQGDLRHWLKNNKYIDFFSKFSIILTIAEGIEKIHEKNLIHRDLHLGNILKDWWTTCYVADLGLCCPVDKTEKEEEIYGVLPYVAPEVLQGHPYTQASDIYSFGIMVHEILSGLPPYCDREYDLDLIIRICQGLRPDLDIFQSPQLLKDLIQKCWGADPKKRPTANEIVKNLDKWNDEINFNIVEITKDYTEFYRQYQKVKKREKWAKEESNRILLKMSDFLNNPEKFTSKLLPTKEIIKMLSNSQKFVSEEEICSLDLYEPLYKRNNMAENSIELDIDLVSNDSTQEKLTERIKRKLSLETKTDHSSSKSPRLSEELTTEPLEINNYGWQNLHFSFNQELIQSWTSYDFTPNQCKDWINIGLSPADSHFASWLRDELHLEPLEVLNNMNSENNYQEADLREQFHSYLQTELQKLQNQLQLAHAKKSGQTAWEHWETLEGLENWIKELEEEINRLEVQEKLQPCIQQPPK
ncbi:MAG: serine/threonine-protein kinase [Candidatus Moeniiplasma glomeromycotorum]|nr:serine/threonine-protein kinase [Candidatus Moeniiplasma glomeromycotorum]MCE8167290.1 serine/threonine-protein kinase [Candidatus Moeniiplasma glomeromycotorum]MCE8168697.1 serine/threonine-protein kinase [Candidatus Moeniiplasma glomeromycotorum]